jgi:hypothetical protein
MHNKLPTVLSLVNFAALAMVLAASSGLWPVALGSAAPGTAEYIEAAELRLVDQQGRVRAGLKMQDGRPVFFLIGDNGRPTAFWADLEDGPRLVFNDRDESAVLSLGAAKEREPYVSLYGEPGKGGLHFGWSQERGAKFVLKGSLGHNAAFLGDTPQGIVWGINDRDKAVRLLMGVRPDGTTLLAATDREQKPVAFWGQRRGVPFFMLQKRPDSSFLATTTPGGDAVVGVNRRGGVAWRAPEGLKLPAPPLGPEEVDRMLP